jgi:hypothetical protein
MTGGLPVRSRSADGRNQGLNINDNYAHFIYALGRRAFTGQLRQFPTDAYFNKK